MNATRLAPSWLRRSRSARMPRQVIVLGVIAFCVAVGFGVLIPVLPVFARSFGVDNFAVGAVVSVFALMRLVTAPFCGRMINRAGERVILAIGIFIVAISSGLAGISQSYLQLLVLRGVGGFGSAMFTVSATTLLLTSVEAGLRGRASGVFQAGFLIGGMTGPAIGGLLSAISLTAPFFFYAATLAVAGTVGLLMLGRSGTGSSARAAGEAVPLRQVVRDRSYQAACVANLAQGWTSFGVRMSFVPVLVVEVLDRPTSWTGVAFACASVVQTLAVAPAGKFVDTVGRRPAMIIGGALGGVSIFAVPFAPNIWLLIVALCLYGVASAFLGTAPAATVGDVAGPRGGTAVAIFSMCSDVGAILGPLVAGLLADNVSYGVAFGVGAGLLLAGAFAALRMPRHGIRHRTEELDGSTTAR
ncbi:MAG TPA: MFS transporter [Propionibacteriaceae bacterium]|nr:MFS transporter [Propionibacteriaceae bacterium]